MRIRCKEQLDSEKCKRLRRPRFLLFMLIPWCCSTRFWKGRTFSGSWPVHATSRTLHLPHTAVYDQGGPMPGHLPQRSSCCRSTCAAYVGCAAYAASARTLRYTACSALQHQVFHLNMPECDRKHATFYFGYRSWPHANRSYAFVTLAVRAVLGFQEVNTSRHFLQP